VVPRHPGDGRPGRPAGRGRRAYRRGVELRDDELRDDQLRDDEGDDAVGRGPDEGGSPAGWLLAVVAALPVAAAAEAARRVMSGGLDRVFTATYGGYPSPSTSLRQRFEWLISAVPVGPALLASTVGVLVVVGLRLSGREPGRWPRRVAAAVAGVVAVAGVAFLAAVLEYLARPPATTPATVAFVNQYPSFVQFGPQAAQVVLSVVLSVAAALALLRGPRPVPAAPGGAVLAAGPAGVPPAARETTAPVATPPVEVAAPAPARATAEPPEPAAVRPGGAALPRPEGDDYALYRRPRP